MARNPTDENVKNAFAAFITSKKISVRALARVLGEHARTLDRVKAGEPPYATVRAKLYILLKDEVFKPRDPKDEQFIAEMRKNLPLTMSQYLEKGTVPDSPGKAKKKAETVSESSKVTKPIKGKVDNDENPKPPPKEGLANLLLTILTDGWIAGSIERADQNVGGIRFVLTSENFKRIRTTVSDAEVEDSAKLIRELRRRFNLFAQIQDQGVRSKLAKALTREVEELSLALLTLKEVVPTEAAKRMEILRGSLNGLTSPRK